MPERETLSHFSVGSEHTGLVRERGSKIPLFKVSLALASVTSIFNTRTYVLVCASVLCDRENRVASTF